ncbi:hypothetical protein [Candidatus Velamenicoccus archaeovorus]|uniref:hypothetical protein n=1 Tax=Velamenicoccus archaeovorus TaxID=1930593 RepID=UPI0013E8CCC6|nr:hypothetical protein [Candidatus Velamenicoccus archaeovorus]
MTPADNIQRFAKRFLSVAKMSYPHVLRAWRHISRILRLLVAEETRILDLYCGRA